MPVKETTKHELIERPKSELLPRGGDSLNVPALLQLAVDKDLDVEKLKELVMLARSEQDRHAAREFTAALAAFQQECPDIPRTSKADIATRSGSRMTYSYAELDDILKLIRPVLAKHGFSVSWDAKCENGSLTSICCLDHINGHKKTSTFTVPTATNAGMSEQQKIAAAGTFADRNSLVRVLGIRTTDQDNDGNDPTERIAFRQAEDIRSALHDCYGADVPARFVEWIQKTYHANSPDELPATAYATVMQAIKDAKARKAVKP